MATMTGTIKIDWGLEVVGDTKDTDFFYARLCPVVNFKRGRLSEEEIAKMIKETIQERLNAKKGK